MSENLLENIRIQGAYLGMALNKLFRIPETKFLAGKLLHEGLRGHGALAAPFVFDIRGGGGFWVVEFDFGGASGLNLEGKNFAMLVESRTFENGVIVMGMNGGANLEGTKGDHIIFAPPFNVTSEEIEKIAAISIRSVEEVLGEYF
jgi:E3 ubiquitin-protein ligase TRIP12